jgi:hypothetical protein
VFWIASIDDDAAPIKACGVWPAVHPRPRDHVELIALVGDRSMQRFYQTRLNCLLLHWTFIQGHLLSADGDYILAADEVVVSKAMAQRVIPSSVSLILCKLSNSCHNR